MNLNTISLPPIKFHDFAGITARNEGRKHQMSGATQAQQAMTLLIIVLGKSLLG
jgi:hypothetical protein